MKRVETNRISNTVMPLLTTAWTQEYPYTSEGINEGYIPKNSKAGCVAIGAAQVAKYFKHPKKGHGSLPSYEQFRGKNIEGYEYQWEQMPDRLTSLSSEESIAATSTLILDLGIAAHSNYGPGTLGIPSELVRALIRNFDFDRNTTLANFKQDGYGYTLDEVERILKQEISQSFPVMMAIPGHFIVCVGYEANDKLYFNYGWGYAPTLETLKNNSAYMFIYGARPAESEILNGSDITSLVDSINPGYTETLSLSFSNITTEDYAGTFKVVLADDFGVPRSDLTSPVDLHIRQGGQVEMDVMISFEQNISFGPRDIQILYTGESGAYRPLRNSSDEVIRHQINAARKQSEDILLVATPEVSDTVAAGEEFVVNAVIRFSAAGETNLAVQLVDKNLNNFYTVGKCIVTSDKTEDIHIKLICLLENVESNKNYHLVLTEFSGADECANSTRIIKDSNGNVFSQDVYVRNAYMNFGEDVILSTELEPGNQLIEESTYSTNIVYQLNNPSAPAYLISLELTDNEGRVKAFSDQVSLMSDTSEPQSTSLGLTIPGDIVTGDYYLNAIYVKSNDIDTKFLLKSASEQVINPITLHITARNHYEYLFLSSQLNIDTTSLQQGQHCKITSAFIFTLEESGNRAVVFDVRAVLEDSNGNQYESENTQQLFGPFEKSVPFTMDFTPGSDVPTGSYKLYLRIARLYNAIGVPPAKLTGLTSDVKDEVTISIV